MIESTLKLIKEQIGLDLQLCDYFTGIRESAIGPYFNVILKERVWCSEEYIQLERFAERFNLIKVEPNGLKRVAIFKLNVTE